MLVNHKNKNLKCCQFFVMIVTKAYRACAINITKSRFLKIEPGKQVLLLKIACACATYPQNALFIVGYRLNYFILNLNSTQIWR